MATFESKDIVAELVKNNGHFEDDPVPHSIYSYKNQAGRIVYAVYYVESHVDIFSSPYVEAPIMLLWSKDTGITIGGKQFLEEALQSVE